jgi:hypothetical protein
MIQQNTSGRKEVECLNCGWAGYLMRMFPLSLSSCPHCKRVGSKWLRRLDTPTARKRKEAK